MVHDADVCELEAIIEELAARSPLTQTERQAMEGARAEATFFHPETGILTVDDRWRSKLFDHIESDVWGRPIEIRKQNQNLSWQIETFRRGMEDWFERGHGMPPHYADRITTLLRKAKMFDSEKRFLTAYFRHFWSKWGGATDMKLAKRAIKIGIDLPHMPRDPREESVPDKRGAFDKGLYF